MKSPDKALPSFLTGATLSAVLALSGFPFVAAAVLLIAYMVAMDYWQPVRDGEEESKAIRYAYKTERRWKDIRMDRVKPGSSEQWVRDASHADMADAIFKLWKENASLRKAEEQRYQYLVGTSFIVENATAQAKTDEENGEDENVLDNVVYLKL